MMQKKEKKRSLEVDEVNLLRAENVLPLYLATVHFVLKKIEGKSLKMVEGTIGLRAIVLIKWRKYLAS